MGFCLPASIGAAFGMREQGREDFPVISISGDGGFVMNAQEMSVAAAHRLPIKIIVINNRFLGMVRQWQEFFFEKRYSAVAMTNPDFVKLAEAYGITARRVEKREEIADAVAFLASGRAGYITGQVLAVDGGMTM